jgi:hypothetical protein
VRLWNVPYQESGWRGVCAFVSDSNIFVAYIDAKSNVFVAFLFISVISTQSASYAYQSSGLAYPADSWME